MPAMARTARPRAIARSRSVQGALEGQVHVILAGSRESIPVERRVRGVRPGNEALTRSGAQRIENSLQYAGRRATGAPAYRVVDSAGMPRRRPTMASGRAFIRRGLGFMFNNFMPGYDPRPGSGVESLRPGEIDQGEVAGWCS